MGYGYSLRLFKGEDYVSFEDLISFVKAKNIIYSPREDDVFYDTILLNFTVFHDYLGKWRQKL